MTPRHHLGRDGRWHLALTHLTAYCLETLYRVGDIMPRLSTETCTACPREMAAAISRAPTGPHDLVDLGGES